jgi:DNA ligase-associated metallophosphoesterase
MRYPEPKLPHAAELNLRGEHLQLLPQKALWWPARKALLLADLHLGKAAHFRKAGIPISRQVHEADYRTLNFLLQQTQASHVIFLGDLFHSRLNNEWNDFLNWLEKWPGVRFELVKGNHDILPEAVYASSRLHIVTEKLEIKPFLLTHEPGAETARTAGLYNLCGHLHPAVKLRAPGMQQLMLPCFYFGLHGGVLPAFGNFTGFSKISVQPGDVVYAITPERVLLLPTN